MMKQSFKSMMLMGAFLFSLLMCLTSCEDILGHWERPTPTNVTPSGGGDDDGGGSTPSAYTMAKDATSADKGKLICLDGHIHADGADTECTKDRVAMICYVGNDAETNTTFNHGLALALSNAGSERWCSVEGAQCLATLYADNTAAKTDVAGIANTDALVNHASHTHAAAAAARNYNGGTHPTGTSEWFLPSAGQWDKMGTAVGGHDKLATNAGLGTGQFYKSSSELDTYHDWNYQSYYGGLSNGDYKSYDGLVRACLAF